MYQLIWIQQSSHIQSMQTTSWGLVLATQSNWGFWIFFATSWVFVAGTTDFHRHNTSMVGQVMLLKCVPACASQSAWHGCSCVWLQHGIRHAVWKRERCCILHLFVHVSTLLIKHLSGAARQWSSGQYLWYSLLKAQWLVVFKQGSNWQYYHLHWIVPRWIPVVNENTRAGFKWCCVVHCAGKLHQLSHYDLPSIDKMWFGSQPHVGNLKTSTAINECSGEPNIWCSAVIRTESAHSWVIRACFRWLQAPWQVTLGKCGCVQVRADPHTKYHAMYLLDS